MTNRSLSFFPAELERYSPEGLSISIATALEREEIYRLRHEVYARELGQHHLNTSGRLRDSLDDGNHYLVGRIAGRMAGFISITPPELKTYSIDKYFRREDLPFPFNAGLYEIRLLTVLKSHRGGELSLLLMYAALRWVESRGGQSVVAIGRREILDLYLKVGLRPLGRTTRSGSVTYDLLYAPVGEIRASLDQFGSVIHRLESKTRWNLSFPFRKPASCFHGGEFFSAIGERFDTLEKVLSVINADVLDAWFPPSPKATEALMKHLPWLMRTSPPAACEGLIEQLAMVRGVAPANLLPGAGSSDLIFRALTHWLGPSSRVLILDPSYSEYAHVLREVVRCMVDLFPLCRENHYDVDLTKLADALSSRYELAILVNPNSPTGRHIPRAGLENVLRSARSETRVWIDETYVDYVGRDQSLERFAARSENVVVCKSMSKVYALSGVRAAYLCAGAHQLESLRAKTPPWVIGLPAQVAAAFALRDEEYYAARYQETQALRDSLAGELKALEWQVIPGSANFLLCHLPEKGPSASELVARCGAQNLFLRNAASMGTRLGEHAIRIAVKDSATNTAMLRILKAVLS